MLKLDAPARPSWLTEPARWVVPQSTPVALVSMPTLSAGAPNFQIGLLKPTLEQEGLHADCFSLNMYFGQWLGWRLHESIAEVWPSMVGEWVWSKAAFGDDAVTADSDYFAAYEGNFARICREAGCTVDDLVRIRDVLAPEFIESWVHRVEWGRYGLVGFSIVFQQLVASIAMARALKAVHPSLPVIFGGGSLEDDIGDELLRRCPAIDYVHIGDADDTFPEMIRRLYSGASMRDLPGVMWRDVEAGGEITFAGRAPNFEELDRSPAPDFREYFDARAHGGYDESAQRAKLWLPIETARGCWWGAKNHCTFCGRTNSALAFRAKSSEVVLDTLRQLSERHGVFDYNAIDDIMEPSYVDGLFTQLAEAHTDYRFHYDVRANLSREKLRKLKAGGLYSVQAGVESFSTPVLKLMAKNMLAIKNVEFIKWTTYYGIKNLYHILYGFSGETEENYRRQMQLIRRIVHLEPPGHVVRARADRGSPMYTASARHGIRALRPTRCYDFIFPDSFARERAAYYFDAEPDPDRALPSAIYAELGTMVSEWQRRWREGPRPILQYRKHLGALTIEDARYLRTGVRRHTLRGDEVALYEHLLDLRKPDQVFGVFAEEWAAPLLGAWVDEGLVLHEDDRYLALALPVNPGY